MTDRSEIYQTLLPQIKSLLEGEANLIANMANVSAAIFEALQWHWVGWYLVDEGELVLGPFQGPVACTRIAHGKGVCGTAWAQNQTQLVPNVDRFPGHIACSEHSKSEVVIPIHIDGKVVGVFDIDSTELNDFSEKDTAALEQIVNMVAQASDE